MKYLLAVVCALALTACEGDGDRTTDRLSTPSVGPIFCKSPVDGSFVPKPVALEQARQLAQKLRQTTVNTTNVDVRVSCDDKVEVVPVVE